MRLFCMLFSTIPPFIGFLMMSLLPNDDAHRWSKWGGYFMTVVFVITLFLAWTLIPSNTAGRTKRTLTSSFTFVGYCVGNMCGSQIFKSSDAPKYVPGTVGCAVCFGLQFFLIATWRLLYMSRNRRTRKRLADEGIDEQERIARGKALGEQDMTDFENPYVSVPILKILGCVVDSNCRGLVHLHDVTGEVVAMTFGDVSKSTAWAHRSRLTILRGRPQRRIFQMSLITQYSSAIVRKLEDICIMRSSPDAGRGTARRKLSLPKKLFEHTCR